MRSIEEAFLARVVQKEVDSRASGIYNMTEAERRKHFFARGYLLQVKKYYGIRSIYYPGCTGETILESAFDKDEIFYLDKVIKRNDNTGTSVVGDMLAPPFPENTFDAAYVQDLHLHEEGREHSPQERLDAILSMVKDDGIIIYGKRGACPIWTKELPFLRKQDSVLTEVRLPFAHEEFAIFQRI